MNVYKVLIYRGTGERYSSAEYFFAEIREDLDNAVMYYVEHNPELCKDFKRWALSEIIKVHGLKEHILNMDYTIDVLRGCG